MGCGEKRRFGEQQTMQEDEQAVRDLVRRKTSLVCFLVHAYGVPLTVVVDQRDGESVCRKTTPMIITLQVF